MREQTNEFLSVYGSRHAAISVVDTTDGDGISLDVFRQGDATVACIA